jgi:type VI secretion system secreted protein Hcp
MKSIQKVALASLVAGTATAAGDASASFDTFIKFEGIQGESTVKGEIGAVKIHGIEFSAVALDSAATGVASGKRQFSPIVIQKPIDPASISLFKAFLGQGQIKGAQIDFTTTEHDAAVPYLTIKLDNVLISSFAISAGGDDRPTESVSLNFAKIEFEYTPQTPKGGVPGSVLTAGWDLSALKIE